MNSIATTRMLHHTFDNAVSAFAVLRDQGNILLEISENIVNIFPIFKGFSQLISKYLTQLGEVIDKVVVEHSHWFS